MPDYQGNSKKHQNPDSPPPKVIEQVVVSKVIVQKKGNWRKFKEMFLEADIKTVTRVVATSILLPAAKNMLLDAWKGAGENLFYGESAVRRRNYGGPTSHTTYNRPVSRAYSDVAPTRYAPQVTSHPRLSPRQTQDALILTTREEAELVLERMNDVIERYDVVSIADLNELIGHESSHTDCKWGWYRLGNVRITQIREGFLIDFPATEPIH